jgi:Rps23 Pro-64 3,4-dihydroxylase Tpa1-like proline 4-hydroxylase
VIGTRRVSYIIYLTDPDEPWCAADGGNLELYALGDGGVGCPSTSPVRNILPTFNHMVLFTVSPMSGPSGPRFLGGGTWI